MIMPTIFVEGKNDHCLVVHDYQTSPKWFVFLEQRKKKKNKDINVKNLSFYLEPASMTIELT